MIIIILLYYCLSLLTDPPSPVTDIWANGVTKVACQVIKKAPTGRNQEKKSDNIDQRKLDQ